MTPKTPSSTLTPIERLSSLIEDVFPASTMPRGTWNPAVDIKENEKEFVIQAELPGMNREDLDVHLTGDTLVIQGKRQEVKEETSEGYVRRERTFGTFYRSFRLEDKVDPQQIGAEYRDGVLNVRIPKVRQPDPQRIAVK
ncbi:MAG: Hsp20/alpha crystallin family protein [Armatimonadetes bacterium]|nr:Hsp20/alpha crystallin family protein [Armatimonadota bacterium]